MCVHSGLAPSWTNGRCNKTSLSPARKPCTVYCKGCLAGMAWRTQFAQGYPVAKPASCVPARSSSSLHNPIPRSIEAAATAGSWLHLLPLAFSSKAPSPPSLLLCPRGEDRSSSQREICSRGMGAGEGVPGRSKAQNLTRLLSSGPRGSGRRIGDPTRARSRPAPCSSPCPVWHPL